MQMPTRSTTEMSEAGAITRTYQFFVVNKLTPSQIRQFIELIDVDGITAKAPDLGSELKKALVLKVSMN